MIKINCDGGSRGNPGKAASAFVIKDQTGEIFMEQGKYLGIATNNIAEYTAVVEALKNLKSLNPKELVHFYLDSNLVVNQLNGKFKINNLDLKKLFDEAKILEKSIKVPISYSYVPREQNSEADLLVNKTLDSVQ